MNDLHKKRPTNDSRPAEDQAAPVNSGYPLKGILKCFRVTRFFVAFRRILHIFLQPAELFIQHVQNVLTAGIAMAFIGKTHKFYDATVPFDGIEHPFALDGIGAGIIIRITMDQQQRCFYFISIAEWAHGIVKIRRLPVSTVFILEAEWSKRSVIGNHCGQCHL